MNKKTKHLIATFLILVSILALTFALTKPISSKPTGCGGDIRYSIIKGQLDDYNAQETIEQSIYAGSCGNYGDHKLYLI